MTLTELDALTTAQLPVRDLADHLRLGTGFADDGSEDAVLETYLRAAISAIEARCDKALLARRFSVSVSGWRNAACQLLPIAPVSAVESVTLVGATGATTTIDPSGYNLVQDDFRPALTPAGVSLPVIADGGRCEIVFTAGFGPDWSAVPAALAQSVRLLAASYFEHRTGAGPDGHLFPYAVDALIEPYRLKRLGGGSV